jgi:hypothetical protein
VCAQDTSKDVITLYDDSGDVKLMIQYLYEGDYEPKLPVSGASISGTEPQVIGTKQAGYSYKFPHSCGSGSNSICPHHYCFGYNSTKCVDFVCEHCCPTWIAPIHTEPGHMLLHADMYELGKKYKVVGLKDLACEKFQQWCGKHWNANQFTGAAHLAVQYSTKDDRSLIDVVVKTVSDHICLLDKPQIQSLMRSEGLAMDLLSMRADDLGWVKSEAAE